MAPIDQLWKTIYAYFQNSSEQPKQIANMLTLYLLIENLKFISGKASENLILGTDSVDLKCVLKLLSSMNICIF